MKPKTPAQERLLATITPLLEGIAARAGAADRGGGFFHESFEALREAGYFGAPVPAAYGGGGYGLADLVLSQRAIARADGSTAYAVGMHLMTVGQEVAAQSWPAPVRERIFRDVATTGATINSVVTEPALGSIQGGGRPAATFTPAGEGRWRLSGHKTFSTLAPVLTFFLTAATFDDGSGDVGRAIVPRDRPGLRVEETWDALGLRATGSHDVYFADVPLEQADFITRHDPEQSGQRSHDFAWFALLVAAASLGIAEAARDYAVDYARRRRPTGYAAPISQIPYIRHEVGRLEIDLMQAWALLGTTAEAWDAEPQRRGALLAPALAAAKLHVTDTAVAVVDRCMRIVGGVSLQRSEPLERYYRDVRGPLANPPITPRGLEMIARAVLDGE